ncbi:MAG TPA: hypothetical protein VD906_10775 [Caulobacteraceae bacterium]|nr:hypothetical protein [Caulobacteraceae bacterium]
MLWVQDPDENGGEVSTEELREAQAGIIRLHYANLLDRLGHIELAAALRDLVSTRFRNRRAAAMSRAITAFDALPAREVSGGRFPTPQDELVGGFVTRGGVLPDASITRADQEALSRLKLRPAFVGVERAVLKLALLGDIDRLENHKAIAALRVGEEDVPRDNGTGGWIVRLDEGEAFVK